MDLTFFPKEVQDFLTNDDQYASILPRLTEDLTEHQSSQLKDKAKELLITVEHISDLRNDYKNYHSFYIVIGYKNSYYSVYYTREGDYYSSGYSYDVQHIEEVKPVIVQKVVYQPL